MNTYSKLILAVFLASISLSCNSNVSEVQQVGADKPPRDGTYVEYHDNGKKKLEAHYKNGKSDGLQTEWDENGNKTVEIQFKDGAEVSRKEF